MLHLHQVPLKLWAESIHIVVHLLNRTIHHYVGFITPYELWFNTKPSVSHYRIFSTVAYTFIDKSLRTKFQAKGHMAVFVGHSDTSKGWRFWNPSMDTVSESSDVIFDETTGYTPSIFPQQRVEYVDVPISLFSPHVEPPSTDVEVSTTHSTHNSLPIATSTPTVSVGDSEHTNSISPLIEDSAHSNSTSPNATSLPSPLSVDHSPLSISEEDPSHSSLPSEHSDPYALDVPSNSQGLPSEPLHPKFCSLTDIYFEAGLFDTEEPNTRFSFANMIHTAETYREPATYKQAHMSLHAAYWKEAMQKEYDSLMDNHTWTLVPSPPSRKVIQCKWVLQDQV